MRLWDSSELAYRQRIYNGGDFAIVTLRVRRVKVPVQRIMT